MKDNKTCNKPSYTCAICGTEHISIQDRANCEMACLKKLREEEKMAAEAKKKAEKAARKAEVDEALKKFAKLAEAYTKDYGSYECDGEIIPNMFWPNKLWHHFWY